jgi:hypothetical protein
MRSNRFKFRILVSSFALNNRGADYVEISSELKMKELGIKEEQSRKREAENAGILS